MTVARPGLAALLVLITLGMTACSKDADDDRKATPAAPAADLGPGVTVDAPTRQRLGVELAAVAESADATVADGVATVLDGAALTATLDDIAAARADVASQAENFRRLQGLYDEGGNASMQALEAARAQLATARARLTAAESRARADWGGTLVDTADAPARAALNDLRRGEGALLRAEFATSLEAAAQLHFAIGSSTAAGNFTPAHFIGLSRAPTLSAGGAAVTLALSNKDAGPLALRPGSRVRVIASVANGAQQAIVPESAVIADAGALWCYVERPEQRLERMPLDSERRVAAGYPAPGLHTGDRVVVRGAPLLLSLERGAGASAPADED
jgi:hypothetical protein